MSLDLTSTILPAIVIIVVVLVLEEWAFFRTKSKFQRAVITGLAVLALLVVFNLFLPAPGY